MRTSGTAVQEGMPRPPSDAVQIAIRVPKDWLAKADELARQISRPGFEASRTDAFRAAIARGFEEMRNDFGASLGERLLDRIARVESETGAPPTRDALSMALFRLPASEAPTFFGETLDRLVEERRIARRSIGRDICFTLTVPARSKK